MLILAAIATLIYVFVNAIGAWTVLRRKPWLAGLFMAAAALLAVAFSALIFSFEYTRVILASGLILASLASFLNAHLVLGNVVWRFHVARAAVGVAIYTLANLGLG